MKIKEFFTVRTYILLIAIFLALLAINPNPWASGLRISNVQATALDSGLKEGMILQSLNSEQIDNVKEFDDIMNSLFEIKNQTITVETDKNTSTYTTTNDLGFIINNLTILDAKSFTKLQEGSILKSINNIPITDDVKFEEIVDELFPAKTITIETNKGTFAFLTRSKPQIRVEEVPTTNLVKGLDLRGGTRILLQPVPEDNSEVTESQIDDIVKILNNRLNTYGLSDLKIRAATDLSDNKFVIAEIAGVSPEEARELLSQQGKFEAKIGEDLVFVGGNKDITFVCRDDGSCSGIRPPCQQFSENNWQCTFQFVINLSPEAAKRHAELTSKLDVNFTSGAGSGYLSKPLDLFLDNELVGSLQISESLKGQEETQIQISGPGFGTNEEDAFTLAIKEMEQLQTVLITGSLPFKLEIVQVDTISPTLGQSFIKNIYLIGILSLLSVSGIIYYRYRKLIIIFPMIFTILTEIFITLGVAALIQWNLDLLSIAGILAAIGTGIDDQIVIVDEVLSGESKYLNWKERIKRAFSIILAAYVTTAVAMIPLWNAGAGLVRGLAVTTIIGISIGVFITRPAFASIVEKILEK
jgi:preprotein translocase subunit SecD